MKSFLYLSFVLLPTFNLYSQEAADAVLANAHRHLDGLKNIRYHHTRELNYSSENYRHVATWDSYYDFQSTDTIIGFKYQIEDAAFKQVFNGTEIFELDKKSRTMQINDHPGSESLNSISAMYNSLITLRNVIPLLITDKSATKAIADTAINNIPHLVITVNTGKRRIQNTGKGFDAMTTKSNFIYRFILKKDSKFIVELLQANDSNNDFIKTSFTNIETNTLAPPELSWYYSSYITDYKLVMAKATPPLKSKGSPAPGWKLEVLNEGRQLSLNDLRGKVVLLDFWIKNCGACINSVPYLNRLQDKFKNKDFTIISINSYDAVDEVKWFCNKHKTNFPVLLNGKDVAEEYGVSGFPAFFIIDKGGKIVYSNAGYDQSIEPGIEASIKEAL